ncbi:MAG: hypothetical protein KDA41_03135, partial [Planctomycetales bacterium]|nr:hypothetical protein [Planctomycetales bacterium]
FGPAEIGSLKVGLQIGAVYRFQVSRIPNHVGGEVFPSVEVIDRLHPPEGAQWRFPIPIQLTENELGMALDGKFVTRVIYVENPTAALAHASKPNQQRYYEVRPDADPLEAADALGRPVAILRIGSRMPGESGPDSAFLYGSPPVVRVRGLQIAPPRIEELPPGLPQAAVPQVAVPRGDVARRSLFPLR